MSPTAHEWTGSLLRRPRSKASHPPRSMPISPPRQRSDDSWTRRMSQPRSASWYLPLLAMSRVTTFRSMQAGTSETGGMRFDYEEESMPLIEIKLFETRIAEEAVVADIIAAV